MSAHATPAPQEGDGGFRQLGERTVHAWGAWRLVEARFEAPHGEAFARTFVRSPGAVGVVPVVFDPEGSASVVLVRQYRPALGRELLEVPAGMRDVDDEPPEVTARRELVEEAGLAAGRLELLTSFLPSAGMTDSTTIVYLATELREAAREVHGPEEQHLQVVHLPLDDAVRRAETGEIDDAKTVIGLLLAARRLTAGDDR